ncbi:MarR family winged helix-turn-helix transcriptional regulator [Actinoplanes sp. N902-109]|uniref:MarR family winged helix-turn-helix transcriptional regulator n=1 Tax=Actinoplanes sp. (strain N902-109) TaxID=649831 RepID=UPI000329654B|nr:MarR family transcriptional regulator [Actinoplanes sp. N902-109]AGL16989.1 MarR family transcriptional regulator [Actinoplanes sp. N902-109]
MEDDLAERLRQAIGRFVRVTRARADTIPAPQAAALAALDRDGPQTIAGLAAGRGVKHQSMSRTLAELAEKGLVSRAPSPGDGRAVLIALTPAGATALEADRQSRRQWVAAAIEAELSAEERRILGAVPDILDRLSATGE